MAVARDPEKEALAARVEELAAGRRLARTDLTPKLLRETVEAVAADDDIRASAATCSTALQRCDGPARGRRTHNHLS
ncbi:hypothetical protein [Saccharopolyspora sp. SCSIO 74807]|uniref:hypothetical protein n=1 Tax=Saccharopolyspora sp. SCSIO 74807 TaxID=3118084 RepID=UPI0030D272D6